MDQTIAKNIINLYVNHTDKISAEPISLTLSGSTISLQRLSSDTSIKQFAAIHFQQQNYLLIILPTTGKTSEEIFVDENPLPHSQADAFIQSSQILSEYTSAIPPIYAINQQHGIVLTARHGNTTFYDAIEKQLINQQLQAILQRTIDWIIQLQSIPQNAQIAFIAHQRQLAKKTLFAECQEFIDYGLPHQYGKPIHAATLNSLTPLFTDLCTRIAALKQTLIHRDLQSKNIMLADDQQIGIIDYQDCCMGPYTYDLASLLYDPYVSFSEEVLATASHYYYQQAVKNCIIENISESQFLQDVKLTAIQRLLKAAGRYIYIAKEKHQDTHVKFFQPALLRCMSLLAEFPEYAILNNTITTRSINGEASGVGWAKPKS